MITVEKQLTFSGVATQVLSIDGVNIVYTDEIDLADMPAGALGLEMTVTAGAAQVGNLSILMMFPDRAGVYGATAKRMFIALTPVQGATSKQYLPHYYYDTNLSVQSRIGKTVADKLKIFFRNLDVGAGATHALTIGAKLVYRR